MHVCACTHVLAHLHALVNVMGPSVAADAKVVMMSVQGDAHTVRVQGDVGAVRVQAHRSCGHAITIAGGWV